MKITDEQIKAMTKEEHETYLRTLPCAVVDFRNSDYEDDADNSIEPNTEESDADNT